MSAPEFGGNHWAAHLPLSRKGCPSLSFWIPPDRQPQTEEGCEERNEMREDTEGPRKAGSWTVPNTGFWGS